MLFKWSNSNSWRCLDSIFLQFFFFFLVKMWFEVFSDWFFGCAICDVFMKFLKIVNFRLLHGLTIRLLNSPIINVRMFKNLWLWNELFMRKVEGSSKWQTAPGTLEKMDEVSQDESCITVSKLHLNLKSLIYKCCRLYFVFPTDLLFYGNQMEMAI